VPYDSCVHRYRFWEPRAYQSQLPHYKFLPVWSLASQLNPVMPQAAVLRCDTQFLRPEFGPRVAEKLVFARVAPEVQREICELLVAGETARLRGLGHDLVVSRAVLEFLVREGYDPQLGARPIRRTVERHLQEAVVRSLFADGFVRGRVEPAGARLEVQP